LFGQIIDYGSIFYNRLTDYLLTSPPDPLSLKKERGKKIKRGANAPLRHSFSNPAKIPIIYYCGNQ
jgi:hypothetical protein